MIRITWGQAIKIINTTALSIMCLTVSKNVHFARCCYSKMRASKTILPLSMQRSCPKKRKNTKKGTEILLQEKKEYIPIQNTPVQNMYLFENHFVDFDAELLQVGENRLPRDT